MFVMTNGNESNINEEVAVVTELAEKEAVSTIEANHDGISFFEREDFQGGSQGIDEEVSSSRLWCTIGMGVQALQGEVNVQQVSNLFCKRGSN